MGKGKGDYLCVCVVFHTLSADYTSSSWHLFVRPYLTWGRGGCDVTLSSAYRVFTPSLPKIVYSTWTFLIHKCCRKYCLRRNVSNPTCFSWNYDLRGFELDCLTIFSVIQLSIFTSIDSLPYNVKLNLLCCCYRNTGSFCWFHSGSWKSA